MTRPTEEYVIAKLTLEERLNSLNPYQRRAVILKLAGYTTSSIGRALGTSQVNQSYHWRKALRTMSND